MKACEFLQGGENYAIIVLNIVVTIIESKHKTKEKKKYNEILLIVVI